MCVLSGELDDVLSGVESPERVKFFYNTASSSSLSWLAHPMAQTAGGRASSPALHALSHPLTRTMPAWPALLCGLGKVLGPLSAVVLYYCSHRGGTGTAFLLP